MRTSKGINIMQTNKTLLATIVITAITSTSVSAYESEIDKKLTRVEKQQAQPTNENIGFGTGVIIGGITAGPLGAFVAGVGGIFIAKFINVKDENEELTTTLTKKQQAHQLAIEKTKSQYQTKLQRLESSYQQQLVAM